MDPTIILAMGIPSAITAFCFWWIETKIERRQAEQDKKDEARKQNEIIVLKGLMQPLRWVKQLQGLYSGSRTHTVMGICTRHLNTQKRSNMNKRISLQTGCRSHLLR